jgi:hypothetical protein
MALEDWEPRQKTMSSHFKRCGVCKSLTHMGAPRVPTEIHGVLGPIFYPIDKANEIASYLENQFTLHGLCDFDI